LPIGLDDGDLSPRWQAQIRFWSGFSDLLREREGIFRPRKPSDTDFVSFGFGWGRAELTAWATSRRIACGVAVHAPAAKSKFAALFAQRAELEAEMGLALEWRELPDRKESQIRIAMPGASVLDETSWHAQHEWMIATLEKFHTVFGP
jgi:hypothetical protein